MYNIKIVEPRSTKEFESYYNLRWKILRKPWNQPLGTEKDDKERGAIHLMAILTNKIVGCGRGHFNSISQAQIRYMAVAESIRNSGIGTQILKELEKHLIAEGAKEIILKAREKAVPLYERQGYKVYKDGDVLFGEISHFWMIKFLKKGD
ncbi:MAG: GNAT family N-acetyltransferase [Candidatus Cloacimonetes bacterium]|nr:GNAT family N-acetyltransferase [Candidatus Cloacimonadota bacterium]